LHCRHYVFADTIADAFAFLSLLHFQLASFHYCRRFIMAIDMLFADAFLHFRLIFADAALAYFRFHFHFAIAICHAIIFFTPLLFSPCQLRLFGYIFIDYYYFRHAYYVTPRRHCR
jgi:hypothetical protein